ncbi:MAG: hypothetical protein DLM58_11530 [Pseudonocardiales bacterium]|nr:MAG: hypothetical protein DLM58_11530 [Pseudonocardiales bacterium]
MSLGTLVVLTCSSTLLGPGRATATPDRPPAPTISSVTAQLDSLANRTETLTEKFNAAQVDVETKQRAANHAQDQAALAADQYTTARAQLVESTVAAYEGAPTSHTAALLTSGTRQSYLDQTSTMDMMAAHRAAVAARAVAAKNNAEAAGKTASALLKDATAKRNALAKQRNKIVGQVAIFRTLLTTLTAPEQQAYASRGTPTSIEIRAAISERAPNAAAQKAVDFALAQIGKPYVFAAAGPNEFDCSGLTMAAWGAAGVALPHFAATQYTYGTHVPATKLLPGDLIFLYSDIHHVEIYIGAGLALSAPQEGENVKFVHVSDYLPDFYGATRLP